jgi:hypothetical protein
LRVSASFGDLGPILVNGKFKGNMKVYKKNCGNAHEYLKL